MSHLRVPGSRSLTVVLSETEWQALREVEPDAVGWLQERIRERLGSNGQAEKAARPGAREAYAAAPASASSWDDDEY